MEGSNWRPAQGEPTPAPDGSTADWRSQLQPEARQRIVNKIMDTLKRYLPISSPEGVNELQKIAIRFEEKIYSAAANQSDYLRKISLKMLSMENKSQHTGPMNPSMSNSTVISQNPADPASLGIPSQVNNQGQSVSTVNQSSTRPQLLPQNIQSNSSVVAQSPANLPSALSSITGLNQSNISSVSQSSGLQNMTVMSQNSANNSLGQVGTSDIFTNAQRQMQGRQQQPQMMAHQQLQSQNQLLYQHQLQQQLFKQKLQQSALLQLHVQQQQQQSALLQLHVQQQQQQSLLQTTPLQSSQPPLMQMTSSLQSGQSSIRQTQTGAIQSAVPPGLPQNHLSSVQQSASSLLQQHPQSVARQQQQPQSTMLQQTPSLQQQQQQPPTSAPQHSNLPMQQQLMGQQTNISNVQQAQLLGQQASVTDMQQSQRMSAQQNNILNMQQPQHMLNQQTMSMHQPQLLGFQNNISGLPQQQQQQQQQQQILGSLSNVSNIQPHQRPMHMLQQSKTAVQQQQQNQQPPLAMLQTQGQQSQHQSSQQQLLSQFQSQPTQLQQQMVQQHSNSLQREMQQRIQASGVLLSQNAIEQQKQMVQSQIALPEVSYSTTLDSTAQSGLAGVADLQEEIYQKIKTMKELYFTELTELYQKISLKLHQLQHDMQSSGKAPEQVDKIRGFKIMLERTLQVLQFTKNNIHPGLKDKLAMFEKQIISILASNKKMPPGQQIQHISGSSQSMPQQQQSQVPPLQQFDNYANQQIILQGSTTSMQPASMPSLQHGSVPLTSNIGVPAPQQNICCCLLM